ncbi:MAG: heavy metal response regulator transcription factor [Hydrogenophaga sp.]|uniref:heavy metal response regulator transcription factor n=1 Tax=Hydrogenophaga sp. TaxID=1904254 RepID=UPI004036F274
MKILIVEDEVQSGEYLKQGLREAGYYTELMRDGIDGLIEATEGDYDLVLLDVNLPGIDGWSVLRSLRRKKPQLPVLYLTARDSIEDRVKGLELGADDYLAKPFSFSELLARIKTVLRRGAQSQESTILQVADLQLDLVRRRASRSGRLLDLTTKVFGLLELFMRRRGEVLPRSLIASLMWDINFDCESNVIVVAVGRLRSKIDDEFDAKLLRTVRGMGYVLDEPEL